MLFWIRRFEITIFNREQWLREKSGKVDSKFRVQTPKIFWSLSWMSNIWTAKFTKHLFCLFISMLCHTHSQIEWPFPLFIWVDTINYRGGKKKEWIHFTCTVMSESVVVIQAIKILLLIVKSMRQYFLLGRHRLESWDKMTNFNCSCYSKKNSCKIFIHENIFGSFAF